MTSPRPESTTPPSEVVSLAMVRQPQQDQQLTGAGAEWSPLLTTAVTCSCVIAAVVIAVAVTYVLVKLTWKKNKKAIKNNDGAGIFPSRRISKSTSLIRQFSVLPAEQQLYEGLTPEKRELLEIIRSQSRVGSAGFASRRAMSLAPMANSSGKPWCGESNEQWNLLGTQTEEIAEIRRNSCFPPDSRSSHCIVSSESEVGIQFAVGDSYGSSTTTSTTVVDKE